MQEKVGESKKENKSKTKNNKTSSRKNNKIFLLVILLIILLLVITGSVILLGNITSKEDKTYQRKMEDYGFATLYNNKSARTSENVTKSEAVKLIVSSILNKYDISQYVQIDEEKLGYDNEPWVRYATDKNIIQENNITKENEKEKASIIDAIVELSNAKTVILEKEKRKTQDINIKDYKKYNSTQQQAISNLVRYGILSNESTKLNANKTLKKKDLNKLIIDTVEKFNILITEDEQLETDEKNLPTNKNEYPYIIKGISNDIYQEAFMYRENEDFENPKKTYETRKDNYSNIKEKVEEYYNIVLNVDYETINKDNLKSQFYYLIIGDISDSVLDNYIKYVKENKIKLKGTAKVYIPIVYYSAGSYRVRTKLQFEVLNSQTDKNLLLYDGVQSQDIRYDGKNIECYADIKLGTVINNSNLYVNVNPLYNMILKNKAKGINVVESGEANE